MRKALLSSKQSLSAPTQLIELVSFRSKIPPNSERIDPKELAQLNEIPILEAKEIAKLAKQKSAADFLKSATQQLKFSPAILTSIISTTNPKVSEVFIVIVCYQIFLWLYDPKKQILESDIALFLNCLTKIGNSSFQNIINYLFSEMLNVILNAEDFKPSFQLCRALLGYFRDNSSLDSSLFPFVVSLLNQILAHSDLAIVDESLALIREMMTNNSNVFKTKDTGSLIGILQKQISDFNPIALDILSFLSAKPTVSKTILNSFVILASSFLNIIMQHSCPPAETKEYSNPVFNDDISNGFDFNYEFLQPFTFTNFFSEPPYDFYKSKVNIKSLISEETEKNCNLIQKCIQKSYYEYKKQFENTLLHNLEAISNTGSPAFYELMASFLILESSISTLHNFRTNTIPFLAKTKIFDPIIHVFHDGSIDKSINTFREQILNIIYHYSASKVQALDLISTLLKNIEESKFVYIEMLTRILNHENWFPLNSLCDDHFYIHLMKLSREFQSLNFQNSSPIVIKARNSLLIFMSTFASDQLAGPLYIESHAFSFGYFSLIFEPCLTDTILCTIRNIIANIIIDDKIENNQDVTQKKFQNIVEFIIKTIQSCITHKDNNMYNELALKVSQNLLISIQQNPQLSIYFITVFPVFLDFLIAQDRSNEVILSNMLNVFVIYVSGISNFELNSNLLNNLYLAIKKVSGVNPSKHTENMLFCLLRGSTSCLTYSNFIIEVPSILPLILAVFGDTLSAIKIIKILDELCRFSNHNKIMCNNGDVTSILIQCVSSNCSNENSTIKYRGCEFRMLFSPEQIKRYIIPLIATISSTKSNNADAHFFVEFVISTVINGNYELCNIISKFFSEHKNIPKPLFSLGYNSPQLQIEGLVSNDFETGLTLSFSLYLDKESVKASNSKIVIFSITDENTNIFCFYIHQMTLHVKFETKTTITEIPLIKNLPGSTWNRITVSSEFTPEKIRCTNYLNGKKMNKSELNASFIPLGEINTKIGGTDDDDEKIVNSQWENKQLATIGGIYLFKGFYDIDDSLQLHNRPLLEKFSPNLLIHSGLFNFTSQENKLTFPRQSVSTGLFGRITEIKVLKNDLPPPPMSIVDVMIKRNDCNKIASYFKKVCSNNDNNDDKDLSVGAIRILDLMGQLFQLSLETQKNFTEGNLILRSLFDHPRNLLNSNLYLTFYQVLDSIKYEPLKKFWFDSFILNPWLWSKCNYDEFKLIIHHYSHILFCQYLEMFQNGSYFSSLLNQTMLLFALGDDGKPETQISETPLLNDTYTEKEILICQELFFIFLARVGTINLSKMDIATLFAHISNWKTKKTLIKLLKLVYDISDKIVQVEKFKEISIPWIYNLLNYEDIDIIEHTVLILGRIAGKKTLNHFIIAASKIVKYSNIINIFDRISQHIIEMPLLYAFLSILSLGINKNYSDQSNIFEKLSDNLMKIVSENARPEIAPMWYIFPLLTAFEASNDSVIKISKFIAHILITTDPSTFKDECEKVFSFLELFCALVDKWDLEIPFYIIESLNSIKNKERAATAAKTAINIALFKTWEQGISDILFNEFEKSDYQLWMPEVEVKQHKAKYDIQDITTETFPFDILLKEDVSNYKVAFNISLNPNGSLNLTTLKILNIATNLMKTSGIYSDKEINLILYFTTMLSDEKQRRAILDQQSNSPFLSAMFDADLIIQGYRAEYQKRFGEFLTQGITDLKKIDSFIHKYNMIKSPEDTGVAEFQMRAEYNFHLDSLENSQELFMNRSMFDQTCCYSLCPFKLKSILPNGKKNEPVPSSEMSFEHQATLLSFNKPAISINFRLNKKNIVMTSNLKNRVINLSSIEYILPRCNGYGCEIVLTNGKSYLINFQSDFNLFTKAITHSPLPSCMFLLKSDVINPLNLQKQWVSGNISNFDYLIQLNNFAGRSFKDRAAFPLFPSVLDDFNDIKSVKDNYISITFTVKKINFDLPLKESMERSDAVRADYYFRAESIDEIPPWAKSSFDCMVKLRRILESNHITSILHQWIDQVFIKNAPSLLNMNIFKGEHPPRHNIHLPKTQINKLEISNTSLKEIVAGVNVTSDVYLVISRNGTAGLLRITTQPSVKISLTSIFYHYSNQKEATTSTSVSNFSNISSPSISSISSLGISKSMSHNLLSTSIYGFSQGKIVWYSNDDNKIRLANGIDCKFVNSISAFIEVPAVACSESDIFFCVDSCTVERLSPGELPTPFIDTNSRIITMVADDVFHVFVLSTIDGNVHIYNMPHGNLVKKLEIGSEVHKILITPKWGLIVMETEKGLIVSNINGMIVQRIQISEPILNWFAYSSRYSFDMIIFENLSHQVGILDPLKKNQIKIFYENKEPTPLMAYDPKTNSFILVTENKKVIIVPHP